MCTETEEESGNDKSEEVEEVEGTLGMFQRAFGKCGQGSMLWHLYGRQWVGTVSRGVKAVWKHLVEDEDVLHVLRVYDGQETVCRLSPEEC